MISGIDREYYVAEISERYPCEWMDYATWKDAVNRAIDKTIEAYTKNGELLVEDWDMFDQDLDNNVYNALIS